MTKRTTMADLEAARDSINTILEKHGHDYRVVIDHAYGQPRPFKQQLGSTGVWDLGPRLPMGECLRWLWAFFDGLLLGTKIAALPEPVVELLQSELWMAFDGAKQDGDDDTPDYMRRLADAVEAIGNPAEAKEWRDYADIISHDMVSPKDMQEGDLIHYGGKHLRVTMIDTDNRIVKARPVEADPDSEPDPTDPHDPTLISMEMNMLAYLLERGV